MSESSNQRTRAVASGKKRLGDVPATPPSPADGAASTDEASGVPPTRRESLETGLRVGEVVEGRYRLTALLGAGGQGEVWRAEDLAITGHVVALKLLFDRAATPEQKEMLLRELRMLASVSHPAVVQFKDHGWLAGRLWFVMPFLAGKSLEEQMPITRAEARRIFETLAGGLSAVHAKGLRHQDIKPSNIFLAEIEGLDEPMPMLLDFGVAAKEGEVLVAGSPDYFAPELAAGWPMPAHIGPAADIFSLALTLRNALEPNTAPTLDAYDPASLARRGKEPIAPPQGKDLAFLAPSFARWLAIEPERRPSAAELRAELEILTQPEERKKERGRIVRRVAPWAAIALAVATLGSWWGWTELVAARKATAAEAAESEAARREAEAAASRAEALDSRLDEALGRADEAASRTEDALGRLDDAEAAIGRAEGSAEAMRTARDRLRAALVDARSEIEAQATALSEAHESVGRLRAELASAQADLGSARRELTATRASLGERDSELAETRTDLEGARSERDARASERDAARARNAELEARVSSLEASVASAEAARSAAEASARTAEASARTAEDRRRALEERIGELEARTRALEADLEEARRRGRVAGPGPPAGGVEVGPIVGGVEVSPIAP